MMKDGREKKGMEERQREIDLLVSQPSIYPRNLIKSQINTASLA
jgi:hypothetical protein